MNMSSSANYVTQQSIWGNQRLGRLTNRRIREYQALGYYSNGIVTRTPDGKVVHSETRRGVTTTTKQQPKVNPLKQLLAECL